MGMKPTKDPSMKVLSRRKLPDDRHQAFEVHDDLEEFGESHVPPDEHPGGCVGYELLDRAGILRGAPQNNDEFVVTSPKLYVPHDFQQRGRALGLAGSSVLIGGTSRQSFTTEDLGRFLAKIAHSYAVAVHGLGSFVPFLTGAIRGTRPMHLSHYIGKVDPRLLQSDYNHLHVLENGFIRIGYRQLLVVTVRLLAVDAIQRMKLLSARSRCPTIIIQLSHPQRRLAQPSMYGSPSSSYLCLSINLPSTEYSMRHSAQRFKPSTSETSAAFGQPGQSQENQTSFWRISIYLQTCCRSRAGLRSPTATTDVRCVFCFV